MSTEAVPLGYHRLTLEKLPVREGNRTTWSDLVRNWRRYVAEKAGQYLVFVGDGLANYEEILSVPYSHRFTQEYIRMQYAQIQQFTRGALDEYDDPYFVFLTFSTSTTDATGEPRPPLDHMDEVVSTWNDGVYYELCQVMDGSRKRDPWESREWEYLYILEPTTDAGYVPGGYAHAHAGIVVDGPVEAARFESVIDRHLEAAPNATGDAHEFDDAIVVKPATSLENPGAYMFKYLGKSWDVGSMEDYEERFAALLHETGRQRFRRSNGASRWLEDRDDEGEDWVYVGIANEEKRGELEAYETAEDLRIDQERGVRAFLAGVRSRVDRKAPPPVPSEESRERRERRARRKVLAEVLGGAG